jgi:hypothetical protein
MRKAGRSWRLAAIGAVLAALVIGTVPITVVAAWDGAGLPTVTQAPGLDAQFLRTAARVPGFGGMFLDGDILKVYLVDTTQHGPAMAAISEVFGSERIPAAGVQVLPARYGFARLAQWHGRLGALFNIPGVVLTDIDETTNRLRVGVSSPEAYDAVGEALGALGVPRAAVTVARAEPVSLAATLRDRIRPIEGGLQIAFGNYICTEGFNGVRSGIAGFVTNSHCTSKQGGVEGTLHYQPSRTSSNFIGTEIADPMYTKTKCPSGMKGKVCRYSDSAFSELASGVAADQGKIAQTTGPGSITIAGQYTIVSEGPSFVGQTLIKIGRTTGMSQGLVTATCVDTGVQGSNIVQRCQDFVNAAVGSGDSGSPVGFITSGTNMELRGILWGSGNGFVYSPIANIQRTDELGPIDTCVSGC